MFRPYFIVPLALFIGGAHAADAPAPPTLKVYQATSLFNSLSSIGAYTDVVKIDGQDKLGTHYDDIAGDVLAKIGADIQLLIPFIRAEQKVEIDIRAAVLADSKYTTDAQRNTAIEAQMWAAQNADLPAIPLATFPVGALKLGVNKNISGATLATLAPVLEPEKK